MDSVFFFIAELRTLTDRVVMDPIFMLLRKCVWRAPDSDGQICHGFCIFLWRKWRLQALTDRFIMDSVLIVLRKWVWRTPDSDGQIYNGLYIYFIKIISLESSRLWRTDLQWFLYWFYWENWSGESQTLTDRFIMDSVLFLLRKLTWRAPDSNGQIKHKFCIDFIKKISLESSRLWWTDL